MNHDAIDAWLARGREQTGLPAFELASGAFEALWLRARSSLGERMARSVFMRAVNEAGEQRPRLRAIRFEDHHLALQDLALRGDEDVDDLTLLMARLLQLLGALTSNVMMPSLVAELEQVLGRLPEASDAEARSQAQSERISLGERNLNDLLAGGVPRGSITLIAGPPGAGKTILACQAAFENASPEQRVILFSTLSEPPSKMMQDVRSFRFFDVRKLQDGIDIVDLASDLPCDLDRTLATILQTVSARKPRLVIIDSFKVLETLAPSPAQFRQFAYRLSIELTAWDATALLVGEYPLQELDGPGLLFSLVDGIIGMIHWQGSLEPRRLVRVVKLRGSDHLREAYPFVIDQRGVRVISVGRCARVATARDTERVVTGVPGLDTVLGGGIPRLATVLVAGASGSGKSTLALGFLFKGIRASGGRGLYVTLDETEAAVRAAALALDNDADDLAHGSESPIRIVAVRQRELTADLTIELVGREIEASRANRVVVDSLSTLLSRIESPRVAGEMTSRLATCIAERNATGLVTSSLRLNGDASVEFGPEHTAHGIVLLTMASERLERLRYLEVLKLSSSNHLKGRHVFAIGRHGAEVYPRYLPDLGRAITPVLDSARRLSTGVAGVDHIFHGGLLEHSVTFLSGNPGIGKTTFAIQFLLAGVAAGEPGVYISLAERPEHPVELASSLGMPLREALDRRAIRFVDVPRLHPLGAELVSIVDRTVRESAARRVVIDGATHITSMGWTADEMETVFHDLVVRSKELGATTLLNFEAAASWGTAELSHVQVAALADNYVVMEYSLRDSRLDRCFYVIKVRCTDFDNRVFGFAIRRNGIQVIEPLQTVDGIGAETLQQVEAEDAAGKH